ncbi:hypothetical protein C8R41DRAFT_917726 [Lentinula lateritia]|uniref:Uncharacterized protein n=1 Tax=Lentinula lateritia TaxID=40482 RepID=A0ABQ8VLU2_9AGAR|nr:hypothetical protein C8R41DRAFT_917726 [Lentinula lateritia]
MHCLQPLDVGCFSPLQTAGFNRCDDILAETGVSMDLCDVVKEYMAVRDLSFKESTIKTAWQKSGINPLNPGIFSEADFAPSIASSTRMQLPASYPTQLPHGPDVASSDAEFDGKVLEGRERRRNKRGSDSDYCTDESSLESSDKSDDSEEPSCHCSLSPPQDRNVNMQSTPLTRSHQISNQQVPMTPTAIPLTPSISLTPAPSIPGPSGSHFHATISLWEIELMCRVADLERDLAITKAERDAATVYTVYSSQEASIYKHHLNSHTNKKDTSKRFPTLACVVTSRDGRIQAKEDDVRRQAKVQANEERAQKKKDKERDDIIRRAAQEKEGTEFEGSLNSKNKTELEDIAFSLGLDIDATAIILKIRIDAHFNATPSLKQDPQYMGLFTCKRKCAPVLSENNDIWPSSSQR